MDVTLEQAAAKSNTHYTGCPHQRTTPGQERDKQTDRQTDRIQVIRENAAILQKAIIVIHQ